MAALMKVRHAPVPDGGHGHVIQFHRGLAGGHRALGKARATPASRRATAAAALRAIGA